MKRKTQLLISGALGILGVVPGIWGISLNDAMCYYASDRVACSAQYPIGSYIWHGVLGFAVFFLLTFALTSLMARLLKKKKA